MEREEEERQALLKTMSRTERRKERVASLKASIAAGQRHNSSSSHHADAAITPTTSLVEDGVLFRPGPTAVKLRTARQMQLEVARRRHGGCGEAGDNNQQQGFFAPGSGDGNGAAGEYAQEGEGAGARGSLLSSTTSEHSLTVKRRAYSSDGAAGRAGGVVVLEVNRTGGGKERDYGNGGGGRRRRRSENGSGRPNMIFTPSLAPVGMESVRACPMSLGGGHAASGVQMAGDPADPSGSDLLPGEGVRREGEAQLSRDVQTV